MNPEIEAEILNQWRIDLPGVIRGEDAYFVPKNFSGWDNIEPARFAHDELAKICERLGLTVSEFKSKRRSGRADPKRAAGMVWLYQAYPERSLPEIGRIVNRDYSTIMFHRDKHKDRYREDPAYRRAWDRITLV